VVSDVCLSRLDGDSARLDVSSPLCAMGWFCQTADRFLTGSNSIARLGRSLAFRSVATMTSLNSQPTSSLTELLHETEDSDPVDDRRDDR
jgi:hypothetical protein